MCSQLELDFQIEENIQSETIEEIAKEIDIIILKMKVMIFSMKTAKIFEDYFNKEV
jgi:hydrogenase maturation factor